MWTDADGKTRNFNVEHTNKARGEFVVEYLKDGKKHLYKCVLRASQMALIEERLDKGIKEALAKPGLRLAKEVFYCSHISLASTGFDPFVAGDVCDDLYAAGAGYSDLCGLYAEVAYRTMPEIREWFEERGIYADKNAKPSEGGDARPTGSVQTDGLTSTTSSSELPKQE